MARKLTVRRASRARKSKPPSALYPTSAVACVISLPVAAVTLRPAPASNPSTVNSNW